MPIYEYRCHACRRRTSVFIRSVIAAPVPTCEHCGSAQLSRLFSRVAVLRGEGASTSGFGESSLVGVDENDPRSIARWVRKMSRESGEPLDSEMESDLERMEAGEMPDDFDGEEGGMDDGFDDGF